MCVQLKVGYAGLLILKFRVIVMVSSQRLSEDSRHLKVLRCLNLLFQENQK